MGAGTIALASLLWAAAALPPDVMAVKDRAIQIPINLIKPQEVRELLLFVSTDQGRTWQQVSYATPDKKFFPFFAPSDGMYWFQVCTVDQRGVRTPADLNQMEPGLKVLIDSQPPVLRITSADRVGEDVVLSWQIQEANPDLDTLRLEYRPAGDPIGQWYTVAINPLMAGQVRFHPAMPGPIQLRMGLLDYAGNQAQASQTIGGPVAPGPITTASAPAGPSPLPGAIPNSNSNTSGSFAPAPAAPSNSTPSAPVLPPPPSTGGELTAPPRDVPPVRETPPVQRSEPITSSAPPVASSPRSDAGTANSPVATNSTSSPELPRQELRNVQIINSTQISLDYEVPKQGPSGIRSAKLYMTRDDGRTWEELAEDKALGSSISATLPGEGQFGFRIVVESGAGLSKGPPMPGDAPELRIEVDLTAPYLELWAPAPDPNNRDTLILRWNATDKNLAPNPISLEYATSKNGPWAPITSQPIPNTGNYSWKLNPRLPYRVYIRVTARDLAGNVGEVISPEPQLIDLTKPEAHLRGLKSTTVQIKQ
jgi:hypothetical protein